MDYEITMLQITGLLGQTRKESVYFIARQVLIGYFPFFNEKSPNLWAFLMSFRTLNTLRACSGCRP